MQSKIEEVYRNTGIEEFDIPPAIMLELCIHAQERLKELAAFAGKNYVDFVKEYPYVTNCPISVLSTAERVGIPTLLE